MLVPHYNDLQGVKTYGICITFCQCYLQGTNISRLWKRKIIFDMYIYIWVYIYCFFGGSVSSQEGNLMSSRLALSSSERSWFAIVCQDVGIPNVWIRYELSTMMQTKRQKNILQNSLFLYTWSFLIGNLKKDSLHNYIECFWCVIEVGWKFDYVVPHATKKCLSGSKGNGWPVPTRGHSSHSGPGATSLLFVKPDHFAAEIVRLAGIVHEK